MYSTAFGEAYVMDSKTFNRKHAPHVVSIKTLKARLPKFVYFLSISLDNRGLTDLTLVNYHVLEM